MRGSGLHGAILKFLEKVFDAEIVRLGAGLVALPSAVGVTIDFAWQRPGGVNRPNSYEAMPI
ncbi:MAG: hypothetical protein AAFV72_17135 [Cyanobacteria bacterium J06635_1]